MWVDVTQIGSFQSVFHCQRWSRQVGYQTWEVHYRTSMTKKDILISFLFMSFLSLREYFSILRSNLVTLHALAKLGDVTQIGSLLPLSHQARCPRQKGLQNCFAMSWNTYPSIYGNVKRFYDNFMSCHFYHGCCSRYFLIWQSNYDTLHALASLGNDTNSIISAFVTPPMVPKAKRFTKLLRYVMKYIPKHLWQCKKVLR